MPISRGVGIAVLSPSKNKGRAEAKAGSIESAIKQALSEGVEPDSHQMKSIIGEAIERSDPWYVRKLQEAV